MSSAPAGRLRIDALENRRRIVDASRELFARQGLDVPMKAIARRAGVGMATLYRRFPARQDLLREVFAEQFAECAAIIEQAAADPDPWRGLCSAVEGIAAMQAADQGFSAAFVRALPAPEMIEQKLEAGMRAIREVISRAKKSGQLRADFALEDLSLLLLANAGVVAQGSHAASASRRLVAYMLGSFRGDAAPRGSLPPVPPLSLPQVVFPESASSSNVARHHDPQRARS